MNESYQIEQFEGVLEEILNVRRASGVTHKGSMSRFGKLHEDIQMTDAATGAVTLQVMNAVCCSVLQRVAVCCSVLQCVAVCCSVLQVMNMLQCGVVCCGCLLVRLQGVRWGAVTLPVLQCGAGCCSVLQCVAAR